MNFDRLGIVTSVACAIHCTLLPVFVSSLPILGFELMENPIVEWSLIAMAFLFGVLSLLHGYFRHHRRWFPVFLFLAGFAFLLLNQIFEEEYIMIFIPLSSVFIISSHLLNIHFRGQKGHCRTRT